MSFIKINEKFYLPVITDEEVGDGVTIIPEIQVMIDKVSDEKTQGLKKKNSELLGKLKKTKEKLKQFEGIDPTIVRAILQRFFNDEETKLISAGKVDKVLSNRTIRLKKEFDKKLKVEQEKTESARKKAEKYSEIILSYKMANFALEAGVLPEALEDISLRAKGMFTLNDDGEAVAIGLGGELLLGKDGITPLTPNEWIESLKKNAAHLFLHAHAKEEKTN